MKDKTQDLRTANQGGTSAVQLRLQDADMKLLQVFAHVVEAGGLSPAQYGLNMSLSAVSAAISNLETRLGFRLCDRGRGGFQLTEGGHLVYQELRSLSVAIGSFNRSVQAYTSDMQGQFNIAMDDAILTNLSCPIYKVIQRFAAQAPEISLNITIMSAPQMERALLNNELNIAIGPFQELSPSLRAETVYVEQQLLCCGRLNPIYDLYDPDEIEKAVTKARYSKRSFDDRDRHQAPGPFTSTATAATMEAMLAMVLSGLYLGYLPRHACEPWIERGELKSVLPQVFAYDTDIQLVSRKGHGDKRVDLFLAALAETQT
ncbi:LysR family transcriptional regulator [Ruegeria sp.]|uniref:LysR family transcriptional regulator n=1 Tax=Ruegeria sp. TaxID=1879320 RepID=UPI003B007ED5